MSNVNIFEFATKELSQDAYFKYLLECFNSDDEKEKKMSKCFIKNTLKYTNEINSVFVYRGQFKNIDILAVINDEDVIFIEDKTYSDLHNNQLERYYNELKNITVNEIKGDSADGEKLTKEHIHGYFFKLGSLIGSEESALKMSDDKDIKYINYTKYEEFLEEFKDINLLTELYCEYYSKRIEPLKEIDEIDENNPGNIIKNIAELLDGHNCYLNNKYGQMKFMQALMKGVFKKDYNGNFLYSVNNFGSPCTQYCFIFNKSDNAENWGINNGILDPTSGNGAYFFRLDRTGTKDWYIAINQYSNSIPYEKRAEKVKLIRNKLNNFPEGKKFKSDIDNRGENECKLLRYFFSDIKNVTFEELVEILIEDVKIVKENA